MSGGVGDRWGRWGISRGEGLVGVLGIMGCEEFWGVGGVGYGSYCWLGCRGLGLLSLCLSLSLSLSLSLYNSLLRLLLKRTDRYEFVIQSKKKPSVYMHHLTTTTTIMPLPSRRFQRT